MQAQHNQSAISNPDYWLYLRERRFYDRQYCNNMDDNIYETSHESINRYTDMIIPFIGDMMIQILNPTTYSRPHKKVAHSSFPCLFAHDIQNPALF